MSIPKLIVQRNQLMMKDRMRSKDLELMQMKNNQCVSRSLLFQRFPQRNKQRLSSDLLKSLLKVPASRKGKLRNQNRFVGTINCLLLLGRRDCSCQRCEEEEESEFEAEPSAKRRKKVHTVFIMFFERDR